MLTSSELNTNKIAYELVTESNTGIYPISTDVVEYVFNKLIGSKIVFVEVGVGASKTMTNSYTYLILVFSNYNNGSNSIAASGGTIYVTQNYNYTLKGQLNFATGKLSLQLYTIADWDSVFVHKISHLY